MNIRARAIIEAYLLANPEVAEEFSRMGISLLDEACISDQMENLRIRLDIETTDVRIIQVAADEAITYGPQKNNKKGKKKRW